MANKIGSILIDIAANSAKFVSETQKVNNRLDSFGKKAVSVAKLAATAFAGVQLLRLGEQVVDTIDKYKQLEGRLKLVAKGNENLTDTQAKLFKVAQASRAEYGNTVDLYARFARSTKELNISQDKLLTVTQAVNNAIVVSGASADSANAAIMQLSQGMASGVLRGEELNSVMEQTPRVAQAIADGLGITIGELRKLGQEGKLTSETVINALLSQSSKIEEEFTQMPVTVAQAFERLTNEIELLVSKLDGVNAVLVHIIEGFEATAKAINSAFNASSVNDLIDKMQDLGEIQKRIIALNEKAARSDDEQRKLDQLNKLVAARQLEITQLATQTDLVRGLQERHEEWFRVLDEQAKFREKNNIFAVKAAQRRIDEIKAEIEILKELESQKRQSTAGDESSIDVAPKVNIESLIQQEAQIRSTQTAVQAANDEISKQNALWQGNLISLEEYKKSVQQAAQAFEEFQSPPFQAEDESARTERLQQIQDQRLKEFEVHKRFNQMQLDDAQRKADAEAAYKRSVQMQTLQQAAGFFGSLSSLVGSSSKKQFELSKKLARVQTIINTSALAISAAKDTAGPWPLRAATIAAAIAAGGAQLATINRTTFGSSASASANTGSGAFVPSPSQGPLTPNQAQSAAPIRPVINLYGDSNTTYTQAQVVNLIKGINELSETLDLQVISPTSRNAADIAALSAA